eukprot:RCo036109
MLRAVSLACIFVVTASWGWGGSSGGGELAIHGVAPSERSRYTGSTFTCADGSVKIPLSQVNDDYCDCLDGSDEPGTAACGSGGFWCANEGYNPLRLPSSRVRDGVCDCCDGGDEEDPWSGSPMRKCENTCKTLADELARKEAEKKQRIADAVALRLDAAAK